jgi:hypothetical protein
VENNNYIKVYHKQKQSWEDVAYSQILNINGQIWTQVDLYGHIWTLLATGIPFYVVFS